MPALAVTRNATPSLPGRILPPGGQTPTPVHCAPEAPSGRPAVGGSVTTGTAGLRFRFQHFGASRTPFPQGTDFFSRTAQGPLAAQRGHGRSRPLPLTRCQVSLTVLCPCPLWTRSPEDAGLRVGGGHTSQACPPRSSPWPSLGAQTVLTGETLSFSRLHVPSALRLVGNTVRPPRV